MADPLSIAASIAGLLSAAASISKVLGPYIGAARDTPQIAHHVNAEVQAASIILSALRTLAQNMASVSAQRAALVQLDQVVVVLTDGVFVFSDLEASVGSLPLPDASSVTRLALRSRFQWARKETEFTTLLSRLQSFKSSISLILGILQSDTSMRAEQSQAELANNVTQLLETNQDLSRRLMNLEDTFDAQTIATRRRSMAGSLATSSGGSSSPQAQQTQFPSGFEFEDDLKTSGPYRRVQRDTMDFSFRSSVARSHAWSVFSGLSLGDVSVMSVIALPIYANEITNSRHYEFGGRQLDLAAIPEVPEQSPSTELLLRRCLKLQLQLSQLPDFASLFVPQYHLPELTKHPFTCIQHVFSQAIPLCQLYDLSSDQFHLEDRQYTRNGHPYTNDTMENRKHFAYQVLTEISASPFFEPDDVPTIGQLMGDEITGFFKVINIIEKILPIEPGLIQAVDVNTLNAAIEKKSGENQESLHFLLTEDFAKQEWMLIRQLDEGLKVEHSITDLGLLKPAESQAIFIPLRKVLEIELRFLLAIETNILRPSQHRQWAAPFHLWSEDTQPYGTAIGTQPRNSNLLRSRLQTLTQSLSQDTDEADGAYVSCNDAVAKTLNLMSLPSRLVEAKSEFLSTCRALYQQIDMHSSLHSELTPTERIFRRCQDAILRWVKLEDLEDAFADLAARVGNREDHMLDTRIYGKLLRYDPEVMVIVPQPYKRPPRYRLYLFEAVFIVFEEVPQKLSRIQLLQRTRAELTNLGMRLELAGRVPMRKIQGIYPSRDPSSTYCRVLYVDGVRRAGTSVVELGFGTSSQMQQWSTALKNAANLYRESALGQERDAAVKSDDISESLLETIGFKES